MYYMYCIYNMYVICKCVYIYIYIYIYIDFDPPAKEGTHILQGSSVGTLSRWSCTKEAAASSLRPAREHACVVAPNKYADYNTVNTYMYVCMYVCVYVYIYIYV